MARPDCVDKSFTSAALALLRLHHADRKESKSERGKIEHLMDLLAFALYLGPEKQNIVAKHKGCVAIRRNVDD